MAFIFKSGLMSHNQSFSAVLLYCSFALLFNSVLDNVAVVVCINSLLTRGREEGRGGWSTVGIVGIVSKETGAASLGN